MDWARTHHSSDGDATVEGAPARLIRFLDQLFSNSVVKASNHRRPREGGDPATLRKGMLDSRFRGNECAREGAQTAWWKSVPGQAMTPKLKVTASSRGGVESNRKRTGSPQDNELDSAGCGDEPAHSWRSPEIVQHAGNGGKSDAGAHHVVGGGMLGSLCELSGETCRRGDGGRSQRPNSTDAAELGERRGKQNQAEGSWSGRERKERRNQVTDERKGTECQKWLV